MQEGKGLQRAQLSQCPQHGLERDGGAGAQLVFEQLRQEERGDGGRHPVLPV